MKPMSLEEMKEFLEELDIEPPDDLIACRRLIAYIERGNGTGGAREERIDLVLQLQEEWVGKTVKHIRNGHEGKVLYLFARREGEILEARRSSVTEVDPFLVVVRFPKASYAAPPLEMSLSCIRVLRTRPISQAWMNNPFKWIGRR